MVRLKGPFSRRTSKQAPAENPFETDARVATADRTDETTESDSESTAERRTANGRVSANLRIDPAEPISIVEPRTKILFINQYYWPDHASTAQHLTDLAESFAARGYECRVLCGSGAYLSKSADRAAAPPARETRNGVEIRRVKSTALGRRSTLSRMIDYLSFYIKAIVVALFLPRSDVVVTLTTPPIIGLIGSILRSIKGSKHVLWSMDLHPDASLALGRMSIKNPIVRLIDRISTEVYRRADRVVALGPYMADRLFAKGVRTKRVETIPVWSRRDEVFPRPRDENTLRKSLGLEAKFVVMYSGNLGIAHSFDEFIEAARRLRTRSEIVFLFVGDGPRRREVETAKTIESLDNVMMLDYFPREQLHESLTLADIHLISMRREMAGIVVPGKLYGVMASARPALFVGPAHSETADTIRRSGCGWTIGLGDVDELVRVIDSAATDAADSVRRGELGRAAFLRFFEKDVCCREWIDLVDALIPAAAAVASIPARRGIAAAGSAREPVRVGTIRREAI